MLDSFFASDILSLIFKGGVLILIALYAIFCLIILLQVRGLNKLITFSATPLSGMIMLAFVVHLLLVISLFLISLAIL